MDDKEILRKIRNTVESYLRMNIGGVIVNCPYWMNKLEAGKVKIRGFKNGKGNYHSISHELNKWAAQEYSEKKINKEDIKKFAKRKRTGIDCSGLAYHILDEIIKFKKFIEIKDISDIYTKGIDKTSVIDLTSRKYVYRIKDLNDIKTGDLIRLMRGKHVAVILYKEKDKITYIHSSRINTKLEGVHKAQITITDYGKPLRNQIWTEETKDGESYGRFCHEDEGDGIFRLKVFI